MVERSRRSEAAKFHHPGGDQSFNNSLAYHTNPKIYVGSETFKSMRQKAEKAMTDHEFKG